MARYAARLSRVSPTARVRGTFRRSQRAAGSAVPSGGTAGAEEPRRFRNSFFSSGTLLVALLGVTFAAGTLSTGLLASLREERMERQSAVREERLQREAADREEHLGLVKETELREAETRRVDQAVKAEQLRADEAVRRAQAEAQTRVLEEVLKLKFGSEWDEFREGLPGRTVERKL